MVAQDPIVPSAKVEVDFQGMKPLTQRKTDIVKRELSAGRMVKDGYFGVREFSNMAQKLASIGPFSALYDVALPSLFSGLDKGGCVTLFATQARH